MKLGSVQTYSQLGIVSETLRWCTGWTRCFYWAMTADLAIFWIEPALTYFATDTVLMGIFENNDSSRNDSVSSNINDSDKNKFDHRHRCFQ